MKEVYIDPFVGEVELELIGEITTNTIVGSGGTNIYKPKDKRLNYFLLQKWTMIDIAAPEYGEFILIDEGVIEAIFNYKEGIRLKGLIGI